MNIDVFVESDESDESDENLRACSPFSLACREYGDSTKAFIENLRIGNYDFIESFPPYFEIIKDLKNHIDFLLDILEKLNNENQITYLFYILLNINNNQKKRLIDIIYDRMKIDLFEKCFMNNLLRIRDPEYFVILRESKYIVPIISIIDKYKYYAQFFILLGDDITLPLLINLGLIEKFIGSLDNTIALNYGPDILISRFWKHSPERTYNVLFATMKIKDKYQIIANLISIISNQHVYIQEKLLNTEFITFLTDQNDDIYFYNTINVFIGIFSKNESKLKIYTRIDFLIKLIKNTFTNDEEFINITIELLNLYVNSGCNESLFIAINRCLIDNRDGTIRLIYDLFNYDKDNIHLIKEIFGKEEFIFSLVHFIDTDIISESLDIKVVEIINILIENNTKLCEIMIEYELTKIIMDRYNILNVSPTQYSNKLYEIIGNIYSCVLPKNINHSKIECSICQDLIEENKGSILPCNHLFHFECIQIWLKYGRSCPYCRNTFQQYIGLR